MSSQMKPEFDTIRFTQVWDEAGEFVSDYKASGLYLSNAKINDDSATALFYLLYARYGNNPIANYDINQFKYKVFAIIMQYGPTWEKRLEVQKAIRDLNTSWADVNDQTKPSVFWGSKAIYNSAQNPSTEPSTSTLNEITYINQQNTTNYKKGPLDGYTMLLELLDTDVTEEFLKKFQKLFKQFVKPEHTFIYVTEDEDNGN